MEQIRTAVYFIMVLSALVLVHEWGHYIVAKWCGMHVEDFSLFFGKRLIRLGVRDGTEYNIRAIPLGGFVKIAGMEPDDISNGARIFPKQNASQRRFNATMIGLSDEAFAGVDFDNISVRVVQAVEQSIGDEARLTEDGRRELNAMLTTTGLNPDEHRYLEAILNAQSEPPNPNGYNQKPLWQRAATIFAGPFMSLVFGYVLFSCMGFTTGLPDAKTENVIEQVIPGKPAERVGLKAGDRIVQIDDTKISDGEAMISLIHKSADKKLHILVDRKGQSLGFDVIPEAGPTSEMKDGKPVPITGGLIGIQPRFDQNWKRYSFKASLVRGTDMVSMQLTGIKQALTSIKSAKQDLHGPAFIVGVIHEQSQYGPRNILLLAAMLSISLGIMNLLPIPILDGGHLMLLAVEGIRRRKLSSREVGIAQMAGLAVILTLFVLVMYNDISPYFHPKPPNVTQKP